MSEIKVDTIGPRVDNGTLTIGASGDTVNIAGTAGTGFPAGTTLTGSTNNTVATVTGANALAGETNFIYNGTIVGAGADGASADLGVGVHVKTADASQGSINVNADELILENSAGCGITILSGASNLGRVAFGDSGDGAIAFMDYNHSTNELSFTGNGNTALKIDSTGAVTKPLLPCAMWVSHNNSNITGDGTSITMGQTAGAGLNEIYDLGANLVDGVFTAPVTGKYQMSFNWALDNLTSNNNTLIIMETSNRSYYYFANLYELRRGSGSSVADGWSMTVDMDASDTAIWKISVSDMSKIVDITDLTIGAIHLVA